MSLRAVTLKDDREEDSSFRDKCHVVQVLMHTSMHIVHISLQMLVRGVQVEVTGQQDNIKTKVSIVKLLRWGNISNSFHQT